jgi:glutathione S-transferase
MPLTVHHMKASQSERIPWLCEELGIPYELKLHTRDPYFSPKSIQDLNPLGQAPVIQDGSLTLAESAACTEYIIHKYGNGKLALPPSHPNYADYLYWFHFSNGNLQPLVIMRLQLVRVDKKSENPSSKKADERMEKVLKFMDERLKANKYLAGEEFTAADIMVVFSLTTMRMFYPLDLSEYDGILDHLKRVTDREGYKKYKAKGDPELELQIAGKPPKSFGDRLKEQGKA